MNPDPWTAKNRGKLRLPHHCLPQHRLLLSAASTAREGLCDPEFYTLPRDFIKEHHRVVASGWEKVNTKHLDLEPFKNELGFDLIAAALGVPYPSRPSA